LKAPNLANFNSATSTPLYTEIVGMANPRQKKKARSGIAKARRKPKSKKQLLNNTIIAANWDKTETLAQNYQRLGLTRRLNKITGGVEKKVSDLGVEEHPSGLEIGSTGRTAQIEVGEAKIERDPETGKIVRVLDEGTVQANPLHDPLNRFDSDSENFDVGFDQHGHPTNGIAAKAANTAVVAQLEKEARRPEKKYKHKQSEGEKAFIAELVAKHGDDYAAMARDMKTNYMQRSGGDLKRRVRKWREDGGEVGG
jgi:nucleolar protein 16